MNAQALYELVKVIPKEEWPQNVHYESGYFTTDVFNRGGEWERAALALPHAVMLFESAGIRWLMTRSRDVMTFAGGDWYKVSTARYVTGAHSTLIEAITHAINHTTQGETA